MERCQWQAYIKNGVWPGRAVFSATPVMPAPPGVGQIGRLPCPTLPTLCLPYPTAQQLSDFRHHAADVFVLAGIQPAPLVDQPQIEAQLAQVNVGSAQVAQADFVAVGFGFQQRFLKV